MGKLFHCLGYGLSLLISTACMIGATCAAPFVALAREAFPPTAGPNLRLRVDETNGDRHGMSFNQVRSYQVRQVERKRLVRADGGYGGLGLRLAV